MTAGAAPIAVRLDVEAGALVARVDAQGLPAGAEFAFYLLRDGQRVETRWYTGEPFARFATAPDASQFRAIGFVRSPPDGPPAVAAAAQVAQAAPVTRCGLAGLRGALRASGPQRLDVAVPGSPFVFPVHLQPHRVRHLFVALAGAVPDRSTVSLPRFVRRSQAADLPGSLACIADPTLTLGASIRLGWYFGNAAHDATAAMARVVLAIADALDVPPDEITAYGSSGGGFAAMQLAARLGDGATAIAINAQTDALRYAVDATVDEFLAVCADGMSRRDALARFPERLRLVDAWRAPSAHGARALLVQNRLDSHHFRRHFAPFVSAFGVPDSGGSSADGRIGALVYEAPNRHGMEPRSLLPTILARAASLRRAETRAAVLPLPSRSLAGAAPVILHIGLPKTGTTYLQRTLHKAFAGREDAPIDYPDTGFYNHQIALYEPIGRHLPWSAKPGAPSLWQRLRERLAEPGRVPVLLSAEALCALDTEGVAAFRELLAGRPVSRIVVTVRPLASLLPSHWQQNLKTGGRGSLEAYAGRTLDAIEADRSPAQMFSFATAIRVWRSVFREVPTSVLVMDGGHEQNLTGFARTCGLGPEHDASLVASVPSASEQNLSFSVDECRRLLEINEGIGRGRLPVQARRAAMESFFRARDQGGAYDKPTLSAAHRAAAQRLDALAFAAVAGDATCTVIHGRDQRAPQLEAAPSA